MDNQRAGSDLADTIVVGHDGSNDADEALRIALGLAKRTETDVVVVRAWTIDTAPHGTLVSGGYVSSLDEASAKIQVRLEHDCAAVIDAHPDVRHDFDAKFGNPATVLIKASGGAMMLVVGCRGRGGFASLVLGSVSDKCIRHATCPVLVVRTSTHEIEASS